MLYSTRRWQGVVIGLVVLGVAGFTLFFDFRFERTNGLLWILRTLLLVLVAVGAFTFRREVLVDAEEEIVETETYLFFWSRVEEYPFSCFEAVGVGSQYRRNYPDSYLHYPELIGDPNIRLPGFAYEYREWAQEDAEELAEYMKLPAVSEDGDAELESSPT